MITYETRLHMAKDFFAALNGRNIFCYICLKCSWKCVQSFKRVLFALLGALSPLTLIDNWLDLHFTWQFLLILLIFILFPTHRHICTRHSTHFKRAQANAHARAHLTQWRTNVACNVAAAADISAHNIDNPLFRLAQITLYNKGKLWRVQEKSRRLCVQPDLMLRCSVGSVFEWRRKRRGWRRSLQLCQYCVAMAWWRGKQLPLRPNCPECCVTAAAAMRCNRRTKLIMEMCVCCCRALVLVIGPDDAFASQMMMTTTTMTN